MNYPITLTHNESRALSGKDKNTSKVEVLVKLEDLCRLCGSCNEHRVSIFSKTQYNFLKIIQDFFPQIKVSKDDILPTQICIKCETSLTTWYQFHKACNMMNLRYQNILKMMVKEKLVSKNPTEADENSTNCDSERRDDDVIKLRYNDSSCPTKVESVVVQPDTPFLPEENSPLSAVDRRRKMQRMRARNRLYRLRQKPSTCPQCNKSFSLPETLRRHIITVHSEERPYKCTLCTASFKRNHYLTSHIKSVHLNQRADRSGEAPHLCDHCGKALSSARSLQVHINCVHTKEDSYECATCHAIFYQKILLQNHITRNQCTTLVKSENEYPKTCDICGLEFKTEVFYTKHQMKHMTSLSCPTCSLVLNDVNALKNHLEEEHPEMTPFQCEVCGKKFRTKNFLQKHAVIHRGEKKFECEYCFTKFLKKKYLINHVRRHTGERPFVCSVCNRAFTQISEMRIHKARHKLDPIRKPLVGSS